MSEGPETDPPPEVASDLVEYIVVAFPDRAALGSVVQALTDLVRSQSLRLLDLAVVVHGHDGDLSMFEVGDLDEVGGLAGLAALAGNLGLLSENDLRLASGAVRPGEAGLVLVAEDRWAAQLAGAARRAGGQIAAGERMPPLRVEAALADPPDDGGE